MPYLEVDMTTVIHCLDVSLLSTFANSNVFKPVLLKLWQIPASTNISHLWERVFIGCLSCIPLSSRQPYWCTSFCIMAIQNTLNLYLNPDTVCTEHVEVNLRVCWLDLEWSPWWCTLYQVSLLIQEQAEDLPLWQSLPTPIFTWSSFSLPPWCGPLQCLWLMIMISYFDLYVLESVNG